MKKIAIINQRYGIEVNGGSEYYARLLAEHLSSYYDVEVLTTNALNYDTWEPYYPAGTETVNGIKVRRFPVKRPRRVFKFRVINKLAEALNRLGIHGMDRYWVKEQGPLAPDLVSYIREHRKDYTAFLFVTYLYYTTAMGLPEAKEKAILIPTAHDEPCIYFPVYKTIFQSPRGILYLTEEEKEFVQKKFQNESIPHDVLGVGIDIPKDLKEIEGKKKAVFDFRKKYGIIGNYLIYAGRVDSGKKCDEMFAFFQKYKQLHREDPVQLVIIGRNMLEIPDHPDIHYLGFVSEEDKYAGIAGASCLWLPSLYESLSIALLEGMALGVPGIVNGNCEVLKGHCRKSGGAVYYHNFSEFEQCMQRFYAMTEDDYAAMRQTAEEYIAGNYRWESIESKLVRLIG